MKSVPFPTQQAEDEIPLRTFSTVLPAAPETIPQPLLDQLNEGGIMVLPSGPPGWSQVLLKIRKRDGKITTEHICDVAFVPLVRDI